LRAGEYQVQVGGFKAFIPAALPPDPPIIWDDELIRLLHDASLALGRLDTATVNLPEIDTFISIFVQQEAVLSSQIEGTQCTLEDVLRFDVDESEASDDKKKDDVHTVINYTKALRHGVSRLTDIAQPLPLCNRLLCELQLELLQGLRGSERVLGEFRKNQNHIGTPGSSVFMASFVPPPPEEMLKSMASFEKFLHSEQIPPLILIGLAHVQFETIHPFEDGNGRVGRLLITLFLIDRKILRRPLLYLSHYFKANQSEYNSHLMAVRHSGDWEGWLKFFFQGVIKVSEQALANANAIVDLRARHIALLKTDRKATLQELALLDYLFNKPIVTVQKVSDHLDCVHATAGKLVDRFVALGILKKTSAQKRNRKFEYTEYLQFWTQAKDNYQVLKNSVVISARQPEFRPEEGQTAVQNVRKRMLTIPEITENVFVTEPSPWMKMIFSADGVQSDAEYITLLQNTEVYINNDEFVGNVVLEPGSYLTIRLTKMGQSLATETFRLKKSSETWFWKQVWTNSPLVKPLSSAELGLRTAQNLITYAKSQNKFSGNLVSNWINDEKKLLVLLDERGQITGAKIVQDPELEIIFKDLNFADHLTNLFGQQNYSSGNYFVKLNDASVQLLKSYGLFGVENNQREFERAGKDWILDKFSALRLVNSKRIDGNAFWSDVDSGSHLAFTVDGQQRSCFFDLNEIRQCVIHPILQRQLSERLNLEVQNLPPLFQLEGGYKLKFESNQGWAGEGDVTLLNGRLTGQDTNFRWTGIYQIQGGVLTVDASIEKYKEGIDSIFGEIDKFAIVAAGPVLPNFLRLTGAVKNQPEFTLEIEMFKE